MNAWIANACASVPLRTYLRRVDDSLDTWFKREILAHEGALLRYLNRTWRNREEVRDLRQEVYARVYEAARSARPHAPKAFLFATARHLLADRVRRGRVVSIEAIGDSDALNVMVDELSPERRLTAWQEIRRVTRALNRLPPRCREVVWLRKVDALSNQQVADRLGISVRTVELQISKGMRLLTKAIFGGSRQAPAEPEQDLDSENGHGEQ
jgi:RNA polymerase sigma factor (sigma-70 family)